MSIRILIVDDASFIRDMMKKHLRERIAGAEIFDAGDGSRAIAQLKANNIDLILSDWEMPGMTGEEFLTWVRGEESYKKIPFVMVSSRGDRDHVLKAAQAGVSDYLTKPFTPDELIRKAVKQLKKVGKDPNVKFGRAAKSGEGHAFGSVDALTGGQEKKETAQPKASSKSHAPAPAPAAAEKKSDHPKAQLRFSDANYDCEIQDMSLQALNCTIKRGDHLPTLFDQAVLDLAIGEDIVQINAYVHSIQAGENRIDTPLVKVIVRYVDNDPQKLEFLSKYIGRRK